MNWAGNFSEASGFNTGFPTFFADSWTGSPPSHIKLTRYVVQWDVMRGVGYSGELANLQSWYNHATELQLTPELALDNYNCSGCVAPEKTEYYTRELEALHAAFPGISVFEAWNEPNDSHYTSYVTPAAAAHFMNSAYSFCATHSCTAVAGDFLDSESNMVKYEEEYESNLNPRDPGNWGIHPYYAVKYESDGTVTNFSDTLPNPTTDHIWFTEVGAYYCEAGTNYAAASQEKNAKFLVNHLIPEFSPSHIFYYEAAGHYDEPPSCGTNTALYAAESTNGPVHARPAASIIFGPEGPPTTTTGSFSGVQPKQATLSGSINPQGLDDAEYYFQYGTSTAYGFSTSKGNAGPGLNSLGESATITGLNPDTLYHYRIVATSAAGTGPGSDQTFTTPGPVEAVTAPASGVQQIQAILNGTVNPRGYDAKYYYQYGLTTSYGSSTPEGDAGSGVGGVQEPVLATHLRANTTYHFRLVATSGGVTSEGKDETFTTLLMPTPSTAVQWNGVQDVYYRGLNGQLQYWYWSGSSWFPGEFGYENVMGGDPSAAVHSDGSEDVYYASTEGTLEDWYINGSEWNLKQWGYTGKVAGRPAAVVGSSGAQYVYYRGTEGALWEWYINGTEWSLKQWGETGKVAGSPVAVVHSNGSRDVYYRGTDGALWDWYIKSPSEWSLKQWGETGKVAGNPAVIESKGIQYVYYRGTDGALHYWYIKSPSEWSLQQLGYGGVVAGDPDAVVSPSGLLDVYYGGSEGSIWNWYEAGSGWYLQERGPA